MPDYIGSSDGNIYESQFHMIMGLPISSPEGYRQAPISGMEEFRNSGLLDSSGRIEVRMQRPATVTKESPEFGLTEDDIFENEMGRKGQPQPPKAEQEFSTQDQSIPEMAEPSRALPGPRGSLRAPMEDPSMRDTLKAWEGRMEDDLGLYNEPDPAKQMQTAPGLRQAGMMFGRAPEGYGEQGYEQLKEHTGGDLPLATPEGVKGWQDKLQAFREKHFVSGPQTTWKKEGQILLQGLSDALMGLGGAGIPRHQRPSAYIRNELGPEFQKDATPGRFQQERFYDRATAARNEELILGVKPRGEVPPLDVPEPGSAARQRFDVERENVNMWRQRSAQISDEAWQNMSAAERRTLVERAHERANREGIARLEDDIAAIMRGEPVPPEQVNRAIAAARRNRAAEYEASGGFDSPNAHPDQRSMTEMMFDPPPSMARPRAENFINLEKTGTFLTPIQGIKYTRGNEFHTFEFNTPKGKAGLTMDYRARDKEISVQRMGLRIRRENENVIGPAQTRAILRELKTYFPDANWISGFRVGGAQTGRSINKRMWIGDPGKKPKGAD